eukprot:62851-Chlamydomonas_euryale.AAC.3
MTEGTFHRSGTHMVRQPPWLPWAREVGLFSLRLDGSSTCNLTCHTLHTAGLDLTDGKAVGAKAAALWVACEDAARLLGRRVGLGPSWVEPTLQAHARVY